MSYFGDLNPYQIHQKLINDYILKNPGDTKKLFSRDASKDKRDIDVIRENHRFLWDDKDDRVDSWEKQLAKKYYDKLFKEYCIADLSRYKENKIALRWRIEREVVTGKGQFICGNKKCELKERLRSWEVNFAYNEHGARKNALIKLRLCPECSDKLNHHTKKREIKRQKKLKVKRTGNSKTKKYRLSDEEPSTSSEAQQDAHREDGDDRIDDESATRAIAVNRNLEQECWTKSVNAEERSREEEFDEYLADLLL